MFRVRNGKYNKTDRSGFNIEITDCQLESGCETDKSSIEWIVGKLFFTIRTVD